MILDKIVRQKKKEIALLKKNLPLKRLMEFAAFLPPKTKQFSKSLLSSKKMAVIAEIKRKSPSKGVLRKNFDPIQIAESYTRNGASAISVLTDETFFGGHSSILSAVKMSVRTPLLRKDFIIDEYQVFESHLIGADAILLIAAILTTQELKKFRGIAEKLGLDVLFEAHDNQDMDKILKASPAIIGINNRDLRSFHVDIKTTENLIKRLPKQVLAVSESGIQKPQDLVYLRDMGVRAVLVGEAFMIKPDPGLALKKLLKG